MAIRITDLRKDGGGYPSLDDRMLVLDFQAGHPEAFIEIHRRYGGLARHVCGRYLPNQADADDAFQETMIRVFQGLYRFNGRYALQPWVARIATNVSLDVIRGRARRPSLEERSLGEQEREDPASDPAEAVERLVQRDLILMVLADMPDTHRRALVLRELEGMSHKEIGQALEMSPSQAKALIHRAKGNFRRRWLQAVADRGGLMGLALAPAIWAIKAADGIRRLSDRLVQTTIATEAVSSAVATASAGSTATFTAERLVAAATATVLVAGGVTVGAATLGRTFGDRDRPVERVAGTIDGGRSDDAAPVPGTRHKFDGPWRNPVMVPADPERDPREEPASEPEAPVAEPTAGPPAEPLPTGPTGPEPVVPTPPDWNFGLVSSTRSVEQCGCGPQTELTASGIDISPEGTTAFSLGVAGGAQDADGDVAWGFELSAAGSATGNQGSIEYQLTLHSIVGALRYGGVGVLAETTDGADADTTDYRFSGTFSLVSDDGKSAPSGLPSLGEVSLTVTLWTPENADPAIVGGSMKLYDAL